MGPIQSNHLGGEQRQQFELVSNSSPPIFQHRPSKPELQLPTFPWGEKELVEAPRISGQADQ